MRIADVRIGERVRRLTDSGKVAELANSIAELGLVNPIAVSEDGYLLAGLHRLEACKSLGLIDIETVGIPFYYDSPQAELVELDENLIRSELTVLERGEGLARRKVLYEQVHPETRQGQQGHRGSGDGEYISESEIISFSDDAAEKIGASKRTIQQEIQIATNLAPEVKEQIRGTELADNKTALLNLARMEPVEQAQEVKNVHFASESHEWYTPPEIIERVFHVFDTIDLDPCSNDSETPSVPATHHFTREDDGLSQSWFGNVYMNPPYGREIIDWVRHLCEGYEAGHITAGIALVPSRTDTEWFRLFKQYPRCFIWGRLKFSGQANSAPFPSMVVYVGQDEQAFIDAFMDIGDIYGII
jgi:ParB family transcriptional regulator, chromosome partitioning protein